MSKTFEITILGVNSAFPVHGRHPSCQIVHYDSKLFMIDCGEAAQIQLSKYKIKKSKIEQIFISHLHGDHCFGLPGLLTSFALSGRTQKLILHGPIGIDRYVNTVLEISGSYLPYPLQIIEYDTSVPHHITIHENLSVITFPMQHRMPTMGFRWQEHHTSKNLDASKIAEYKLTIQEIKDIKAGASITREGKTISNDLLTLPQANPRSYSYCSDTLYDTELIPHIKDSTLLYHETTYLDGMEQIAKDRMHSTLGEAIAIAQASNIARLITGHYSSRYSDPQIFYDAGIDRFAGLLLGEEGRTYSV